MYHYLHVLSTKKDIIQLMCKDATMKFKDATFQGLLNTCSFERIQRSVFYLILTNCVTFIWLQLSSCHLFVPYLQTRHARKLNSSLGIYARSTHQDRVSYGYLQISTSHNVKSINDSHDGFPDENFNVVDLNFGIARNHAVLYDMASDGREQVIE